MNIKWILNLKLIWTDYLVLFSIHVLFFFFFWIKSRSIKISLGNLNNTRFSFITRKTNRTTLSCATSYECAISEYMTASDTDGPQLFYVVVFDDFFSPYKNTSNVTFINILLTLLTRIAYSINCCPVERNTLLISRISPIGGTIPNSNL